VAHHQIALFCILAISMPARTPGPVKPPLKEQLARIPQGALVEIRLVNNDKFRGQIGPASDTGFSLHSSENGQIQSRPVAYDDVRSVKVKGNALSPGAKVAIGIAAGVGGVILALVLIAKYAMN
jgi:hypothetical protein